MKYKIGDKFKIKQSLLIINSTGYSIFTIISINTTGYTLSYTYEDDIRVSYYKPTKHQIDKYLTYYPSIKTILPLP